MELLFMILRLRNRFCFCMRIKPKIMAIFMFALFIIISLIVGVLTVSLTSPKLSKTCQLSFKRMGKSSIVYDPQPRSVAVGDFNNDDRMDFVVANSGRSTINIFISNTDGTFVNHHTYSTGAQSHPYSVVVNHFDNDNHLDIGVANYYANNIGIFLGYGNGTFANQTILSTGSSRPSYITVGDFNNDNRSDLAVANNGTNNVGIFLGYGDGLFQVQTTYFTGYDSLPNSLAIGDLNNDKQLDIVVANYGTNNIGILLGHGNGSFENQQTYSTGPNSNPSSVAVGDFNNDNQLDIVVANAGAGNVSIFFDQGNGSFAARRTYSFGSESRPQCITVGDVDKDNTLDLVIVDSVNDQIHILPGYGNENFASLTTYDGIFESRPFFAAVTDFDKDNRSDILVVNYGTNNILVLKEYSSKPSARIKNFFWGDGIQPSLVAIGDLNNDNYLDIVTNGAVDGIAILIGYSNGTFVRERAYSTGNGSFPQYVFIVDLNNDNQLDIVSANYGSDSVGVLLGRGNGALADVTIYATGMGSSPRSVAVGDFDNDNQTDIVSANFGTHNVGVLLGYGNGIFANVITYSTGTVSIPLSVAVGDLNNDNQLDIVVTIAATGVAVLLGYGNGMFQRATIYTTSYYSFPTSVALSDLNSDNQLDIVTTNRISNDVSILLGDGNGRFGIPTAYSTGLGSDPFTVIVDDFNNDNQGDIAATNYGSDEIVIFFGYGNGTFKLARMYSTGSDSKPYGIAVADFNNDKQLEIVVALWGAATVAVLTEYYAAEFDNQTVYSTGSAPLPYSIAVGEFNNDNQSDLVVANSGTDSLGVLLSWGNGMFGKQIIYSISIGSHPQNVIAVDINKDKQLDIITVNSKRDSISIMNGYGNGSFAAPITYPTGNNSRPSNIAIADINNDNRMDLVNTNEGSDSINVFLGFDYASFKNQMTYSNSDNLGPWMTVVNDFNNDTHPDIVAAFLKSNNIAVLLGYGNGTFGVMQSYSTGINSLPAALAVGDINNDHRSDIIVANGGTDNVVIFLGCGNGSFAIMMTVSTGMNSVPSGVAVADFNHDGQMDIAVANFGTDNVGILLGYGNGSFTTMVPYPTGDGSSPAAITVSDFNRDGRFDIAVVNYGASSIGILLGYDNDSFEVQVIYSTGFVSQPISIDVGDFDGDSRIDIVIAINNAKSVGVFLGYGNGTFAGMTSYVTGSGSTPTSVSVGDFNNDNISDVAVAGCENNDIFVLFGFGDGSFLLGTPYSTGIGSIPFSLAVGDFNNDFRLDIAVTDIMSDNIGIFLGYDTGPFASSQVYSTGSGSQPHSVAVSDFNNDGRLDIVVANYGTDNVGILHGDSNKRFDTMIAYSTGVGSAPYSVAVGDFNNDNRSDIVVTTSATDKIAIFLSYGNGSFATAVYHSTGARSRPYTVVTGDFDNNNILDIAVVNSGTNNIFLLYGHGNGTFGNEESYPLGYGYQPYSLAVKDLNNDGWMDIAIACYGTDNVEILMKTC